MEQVYDLCWLPTYIHSSVKECPSKQLSSTMQSTTPVNRFVSKNVGSFLKASLHLESSTTYS